MDNIAAGRRLQRLRLSRGITRADAAHYAGIDVAKLAQLEAGQVWDLAVFVQLADLLNLSQLERAAVRNFFETPNAEAP